MKDFKSYLKENTCIDTITTDYKQALKQLSIKPGSKEWQILLWHLDGDEQLAMSVIENAAKEAEYHFLKLLGITYNPNSDQTPPPERSKDAWVGDKGETVGVINQK